jgi:NAD(P)-dependent dehydrogenase (short-subunit alcohol dehydrogenase family)
MMQVDLSGKIALVTGASSGLGEHFARTLAHAGATVIVAARRRERLAGLVRSLTAADRKVRTLELDVVDPESIRSAMAAVAADSPLDILVNNAGIVAVKPAIEMSEEEWDSVVDTDLTGAFRMAQAAARLMRGRGGSIVNIASILGLRIAHQVPAYAAAKAGLIHLTRALASEWAREGIRVNAIAPGYFGTPLNREFFATEAGQSMIRRIPMRRLGEFGDLDGPLLLLASDASRYMTGAVLVVDGGHSINPL